MKYMQVLILNEQDKLRQVLTHSLVTESYASKLCTDLLKIILMQGVSSTQEDSAGRATMKLLPPEEAVERAVTVTQLIVDRMLEREWLVLNPALQELLDNTRRTGF